MSKNIRIKKSVLFESDRESLKRKYYPKLSDINMPITYGNIHTFYDKVPSYVYKTSNTIPYISGMRKVFRKNERRINENTIKLPKSLAYSKVKSLLETDIKMAYDQKHMVIETGHKDQFDENNVPGHINITLIVPLIRNNVVEHIISLMKLCGYYLAYHTNAYDKNNREIYWWQFEPYYYMRKRETLNDVIYHVTHIDNIQSIQNYGLITAHKAEQRFQYPPRVYAFNTPDSIGFKSYAITGNKINKDTEEFAVCIIDTSLTDAVFYTDPNYIERDGVYTYDNVTKEAITQINIDKI